MEKVTIPTHWKSVLSDGMFRIPAVLEGVIAFYALQGKTVWFGEGSPTHKVESIQSFMENGQRCLSIVNNVENDLLVCDKYCVLRDNDELEIVMYGRVYSFYFEQAEEGEDLETATKHLLHLLGDVEGNDDLVGDQHVIADRMRLAFAIPVSNNLIVEAIRNEILRR